MLPTLVAIQLGLTPLLAPTQPAGTRQSSIAGAPSVTAAGRMFSAFSTQRGVPYAARPHALAVAVDRDGLERLARSGGGILRDFPLARDGVVDLVLQPIEPFTADAVLELGVGQAPRPLRARGAYFQGLVAGEPDSRVFISSGAAGVFGRIESRGRIYIVSSGPRRARLATVVYNASTLPAGLIESPPWLCGRDGGMLEDEPPLAAASADGGVAGSSCRQVRVAFDSDHEFFALLGSDVEAVTDYVATLTSALTTIYERDLSTRISASYLRIWPDSDDPWTATDTLNQVLQLRSNWVTQGGAVSRDTVHMLSGRALGGGIAYMPGLCNSSGYGLSANLSGSFPTPLVNNSSQNWDIFVVAHELGHNFGMAHTHEMVPQIDGCGASPQDCTVAGLDEGSIMSYCHLCPGGLTNIRLEFHPANIAAAESFLSSIACDYSGSVRPPIANADSFDAFIAVPAALDVLANDEEYNCEPISIQSFDALSTRGATISRSVGTGPGGRDELVYTASSDTGTGSDGFEYTVVDASGQTTSAQVVLDVGQLRPADNPIGATSQLDARYYLIGNASALPDYDGFMPYALTTVNQVNFGLTLNSFASSGRADTVGARFSGWLSVPTSGNWRLYLTSDEGSRLTIGQTVVVDHDGLHGFTEKSGVIALEAGLHALEIDYFERTGTAGLVFSWQGPDGVKQVVPSSKLLRGGSDNPADLTNDGRVDALDMTVILANWGAVDSPYDLTGDGLVNGADIAVILFNWTE